MKSELRTWLAHAEFNSILNAAEKSNRTISSLITLTYSDDPLLTWRAIDAIGRCAGRLSPHRPEVFRNQLRRLFWMMSDESGSVVPRAPEIIGEIIHFNPEEFFDFIPLTISLLDLEPEDLPVFLPGILYALFRVGEAAPDAVTGCLAAMEGSLAAPDAQARAMAVCSLGGLGRHDILDRHPELKDDSGKAVIYQKEQVIITSVARLYSKI